MSPDEPGWFYVGKGQLQYKDANGWTDQFQDIDGPAKTSDVDAPTSPDVLDPAIAKVGRGARGPSPFARFFSSAAHSLITGLRLGMASVWLVNLWQRLIPELSRRLFGLVRGLGLGLRVAITGLWRFLGSLYGQSVGLWQRLIPALSRRLFGLVRGLGLGLRVAITGRWRFFGSLYRQSVGLWQRLIPALSRRVVGLVRSFSSGLRQVITGLWRFLGSLYRQSVGLWQRLIPGLSRLLASGRRQASAPVSIISVARSKRERSTSSVSVNRPLGLLKRSWRGQPVDEGDRHRSRFRLPGKGEEESPEFFLDPERLQDLYRTAAGVYQQVPDQGEGTGA